MKDYEILPVDDEGWIVPPERRVEPVHAMGSPTVATAYPRNVWHTTETDTGHNLETMMEWWSKFANPPHIVVKLPNVAVGASRNPDWAAVIQLYPFSVEARALLHPHTNTRGLNKKEVAFIEKYSADTEAPYASPETNGMGSVKQTEIVGAAKSMGTLQTEDYAILGKIAAQKLAWSKKILDGNDSLVYQLVPYVDKSSAEGTYGMFGSERIPPEDWHDCVHADGTHFTDMGHCHVPFQRHWDPGALNLKRICDLGNAEILPDNEHDSDMAINEAHFDAEIDDLEADIHKRLEVLRRFSP